MRYICNKKNRDKYLQIKKNCFLYNDNRYNLIQINIIIANGYLYEILHSMVQKFRKIETFYQ